MFNGDAPQESDFDPSQRRTSDLRSIQQEQHGETDSPEAVI